MFGRVSIAGVAVRRVGEDRHRAGPHTQEPTMTATTTPTATVSTADDRVALGPIWRTGAVAGLVAAGATSVIAVVASALDVSLEIEGEAIPAAGFAQVTIFSVLIGLALASVFARRARHPQSTFTRTTVVLTAVSCIPSVLMPSDVGTQVALVVAHLVAAAIVIPAVRDRLPR
jgi:hypothetical protein